MKLPRTAIVLAAILGMAFMPVRAGMQVVLRDGTVLDVADLKRSEGNYVFTLENGDAITMPAALVDTVRLTGVGDAPSGMRTGEPGTLAGETVPLPTRQEQLDKLGPQARFQQGVVRNRWRPSTDWNMDPDVQNNFAPSTWRANLIESVWLPKSAWDASVDVLASSRSSWRRSIIDPYWSPVEGFGGRARRP